MARLAPRPDVPAVIRRLPERVLLPEAAQTRPDSRGGHAAAAELRLDAPERHDGTPELRPDGVASTIPLAPAPEVEQLSAVRFRVQFTASAELRRKLERLQALMRSQTADPDLAAVIEQAVTEKLERLEARRFGTTKAPRKELSGTDASAGSRYIPAAVRRAVYARDGGRCRYVDRRGPTVPGAPPSRVPPSASVWTGRRPQPAERLPHVPDAQPLSGRTGLRPGVKARRVRPRGSRRREIRST